MKVVNFKNFAKLKKLNVVYKIPCSCGKVYIGEMVGTRLKEHKDACLKCQTSKSAVADHACTLHVMFYPGHSKEHERTVLQRNPTYQKNRTYHRGEGVEIPGCCQAIISNHSLSML